jgi:hypothetical protein
MMNAKETRVVDPILTTVVQGYKDAGLVGDELFPRVPVATVAGRILAFGKEAFQSCDTRRAPGAATKRISFGYEAGAYKLDSHGLEAPLPYEFKREADATTHVDLGARLGNLVMSRLLRGLELDQARLALDPSNYDTDHRANLSGAQKWADPASDPKSAIEDAKETIRRTVGIYPNVLLLSPAAFNALKDHPSVIDRFKYTTHESVTTSMLGALFGIPKLVVGMNVWADDKGKFSDTWGDGAVLAYVAPVPTTAEEPSYGYTYVMEGHPFVKEPYEDKGSQSMVYGVNFERVPVIAGMQAGFLFQHAG